MNRYLNKTAIIFLLALGGLTSHSNQTMAAILDCLSGKLITREFSLPKSESKRFNYSENCVPSKKYFQEIDKNNRRNIVLELQVESDSLIENDNKTKRKVSIPQKAYLTLSPGPHPLMVQGFAKAHKKKSVFSRDYLGYKIYKRKYKGSWYESIFHQKHEAFFAVCNKDFCSIEGIDAEHKIYYELQIFDSSFRDWVYLHELVLEFIEASYHHDNHK